MGTKTSKDITILSALMHKKVSICNGFYVLRLFDNKKSNTIFYFITQLRPLQSPARQVEKAADRVCPLPPQHLYQKQLHQQHDQAAAYGYLKQATTQPGQHNPNR